MTTDILSNHILGTNIYMPEADKTFLLNRLGISLDKLNSINGWEIGFVEAGNQREREISIIMNNISSLLNPSIVDEIVHSVTDALAEKSAEEDSNVNSSDY